MKINMGSDFDSAALPNFLLTYYRRLFPYKPYCKWLSYGQNASETFVKREFAFILEGDAYLRHHSYADQADFEKAVLAILPHKIDIGAVFNHRPKNHKIVKDYDAVQRELVFDIDMTDYDDIRTCCSGGSMCNKCWKFIVIAVKVLDKALKDDFGFKHRLWVFSGRRGVHCWVCDETARKLSPQGRSSVAEYLTLVVGGSNQVKKVNLKKKCIHPSIKRASKIIKDFFADLVEEQGWLNSAEQWTEILKLVPEEEVRSAIEKDFLNSKQGSVQTRWRKLLFRFDPPSTDKWKPPPANCKWLLQEIMLQMAYPRLDVNVTKGLNHLLKSPFCVHPKTGKIAVPFDAKDVENFNPDTVPRIDQIIAELSEKKEADSEDSENTDGQKRKTLAYKDTKLGKYILYFEEFVDELNSAQKPNDKKRSHGESMDF